MEKKLIKEAFRLQTLAGLRPINEINEGASNSYCYGMFDGMDYAIDDNDKQVQIDPEELLAKGYKKLEFTTWEGFMNSAFAKKNQGQIGWDLFHHQGKRFFDMYSEKYGPFIVYVQDSVLENIEEDCGCDDEESGMVVTLGQPQQSTDFVHGDEDHEGSMAHAEIRDLISNASKLEQMLKGNPELPGWVSAYITLASDYMDSVTQYLIDQNDN